MLAFVLVNLGLSLRAVVLETDCAAYADGYNGDGANLAIEDCQSVGRLNPGGGSVNIHNSHFNGINIKSVDGIAIYVQDGQGPCEVVSTTFKNIGGTADNFAIYIESPTTLDHVSFEDFDSGISGAHTLRGSATIKSVSAKGLHCEGSANSAYVMWFQPNSASVSLSDLSVHDSLVAGLVWSEDYGATPEVAGLIAENTEFAVQVVRNGNNCANIFSARFTNASCRAESQNNAGPNYFHGCIFEGGKNPDAVGIHQNNGGTVFVVASTFQNLARGLWSDHSQGGQGLEFCNCDFKNVASGIDTRLQGKIYISGTSFIDYTDRAIRLNSQEGVSMALQVFVVDSCYFAPATAGIGKAIDVFLTGPQGEAKQEIKSSVFKSSAIEVTVKVQQNANSPLVVESSVLRSGNGPLVALQNSQGGDATSANIDPQPYSTVPEPAKVDDCPTEVFGELPVAPNIPTVAPGEPGLPVQTNLPALPDQTSLPDATLAAQTPPQSPGATSPQSPDATSPQSPDATSAQSAVQTQKQSPAETAAQSALPPTQRPAAGGDDSQNNNADSSSPLGAAIGGAVAGVAAIVAALIAFFLIKKRRDNQLDEVNEDADVGDPSELTSTVDLGEDHVFVSEYGLSDNRSPDEGGAGDGEGGDDSIGDEGE
jgi:hypothetical protein